MTFGNDYLRRISEKMNATNPRLEDSRAASKVVFADGYLAGLAGEPRATNPHRHGTRLEAFWFVRWAEGKARFDQGA
jgi:hypothetical protein